VHAILAYTTALEAVPIALVAITTLPDIASLYLVLIIASSMNELENAFVNDEFDSSMTIFCSLSYLCPF